MDDIGPSAVHPAQESEAADNNVMDDIVPSAVHPAQESEAADNIVMDDIGPSAVHPNDVDGSAAPATSQSDACENPETDFMISPLPVSIFQHQSW
jgi:hypothetical protein